MEKMAEPFTESHSVSHNSHFHTVGPESVFWTVQDGVILEGLGYVNLMILVSPLKLE